MSHVLLSSVFVTTVTGVFFHFTSIGWILMPMTHVPHTCLCCMGPLSKANRTDHCLTGSTWLLPILSCRCTLTLLHTQSMLATGSQAEQLLSNSPQSGTQHFHAIHMSVTQPSTVPHTHAAHHDTGPPCGADNLFAIIHTGATVTPTVSHTPSTSFFTGCWQRQFKWRGLSRMSQL